MPEEAYTGDGNTESVRISIVVQDWTGRSRLTLSVSCSLRSARDDRGRFSFRIPIDQLP